MGGTNIARAGPGPILDMVAISTIAKAGEVRRLGEGRSRGGKEEMIQDRQRGHGARGTHFQWEGIA